MQAERRLRKRRGSRTAKGARQAASGRAVI